MRRLATCLVALLGLLLFACAAPDPSREGSPSTTAPKMLIIGLDGADWEIIDRLAAAGRLPNLSRLRADGAWGVLRSQEPLLSPIVWTTIATGRGPLEHGIYGFLTTRHGATAPVGSDERRVRTFWNVASELGVTVGVIGWYASWPAEKVNGYLISDQMASHQVEGSAAAPGSGLVYPPQLMSEIDELRETISDEVGLAEAERFFDSTENPANPDDERVEAFIEILRSTELYRRLVPRLAASVGPEISAVYFEGTDAVGHLFAEFAPPSLAGSDSEDVRRFGRTFDRYFAHIDAVVGELLSVADRERSTVMVISDHGFKSGARRPYLPSVVSYANRSVHWHREEGVLLLWGRGIRSGMTLPEASIYDVLPTMCRLLDLPIADTLEGRAVEEALAPAIVARPPRTVADYESAGPRPVELAGRLGAEELIDKLEALGYVDGGAVGSIDDREGQAGIPINRYNRGRILLNAGRLVEALDEFRGVQRDAPKSPIGYLGEGMVRLAEGAPRAASDALRAALSAGGNEYAIVHRLLGEALLEAGEPAAALTALERADELEPELCVTASLLGRALLYDRRLEPAQTGLARALALCHEGAERADVLVNLGILAETQRELDTAARRYEEALAAAPGHLWALERYANLELMRRRPRAAVALLEQMVMASDRDSRALALYGRALAVAGELGAARTALEESLRREPDQPQVEALLGRIETETARRNGG